MGNLAVDTIDVPHILSVLEPIWHTKAETANRVRSRIERVLSWATARNYRRGENPARWRGGLEYLLPATGKIKGNVQHLAALPFVEIPAFMADLRKRDTVVARAVELLVLTAARSGDVRGACWDEIDGNIWTIPEHRHKSGREFRVPLSRHAVVVLGEPKPGALVFPGQHGRQLTDKMLLLLVKEMWPGITVHGMRSSFRDWAGARTSYPRDVIEMALAHKVKGATESAYWRDDILEKRRRLMEEWAKYCYSPQLASSEVVALHA